MEEFNPDHSLNAIVPLPPLTRSTDKMTIAMTTLEADAQPRRAIPDAVPLNVRPASCGKHGCHFWVERKRRFCGLRVGTVGARFCSEHAVDATPPKDSVNVVPNKDPRIPCPNNGRQYAGT